MIPRIPYIFSTNEQFSFARAFQNWIRKWKDLQYSRDRRIMKSSFVVDFTGLTTSASLAERTFILEPPKVMEIVGVELEVFSSGTLSTVTLSSSDSRFESTEVTVSAVAGNRGYVSNFQNLNLPTTETEFYIALTGNVASIKVTFSYSSQRIVSKNFGSRLNIYSMAKTFSSLYDILLSNKSSYEAIEGPDNTVDNDLRIYSISLINNTAIAINKNSTRIPSNLRSFVSIKTYCVMAVTSDLDVELQDEVTGGIANCTFSGAGPTTIKSASSTINDTQTLDDTDDSNDDYKIAVTREAGTDTIKSLYIVLYYR